MYQGDWRYARTRLNGSIVSLKQTPVYVMDVGLRGAQCIEMTSGREVFCELDSLDVSPIKLGFLNTPNGITYMSRVPKRNDWRQGLRRGNTGFTYNPNLLSIDPEDRVFSRSLRDVIKGKYPQFRSALTYVKDKGQSRAFHRHWAVDKNLNVLYRGGNRVGSVVGGKPVLKGKFSYLSEYLEECL